MLKSRKIVSKDFYNCIKFQNAHQKDAVDIQDVAVSYSSIWVLSRDSKNVFVTNSKIIG